MIGGRVECEHCHELVFVSDYHSNCSHCGKRLHVSGGSKTRCARLDDEDTAPPTAVIREAPPEGGFSTVAIPGRGAGHGEDMPATGRIAEGRGSGPPAIPECITIDAEIGGPEAGHRAALVFERGEHGRERHTLAGAMSVLGRDEGYPRELRFPLDDLLSAAHAVFTYSGERVTVRDNGSLNGVYLKVEGRTALRGGEQILMGSLLFRFEEVRGAGRRGDRGETTGTRGMRAGLSRPVGQLVAIDVTGAEGLTYQLPAEKTLIGRESGAYTFAWDRRLSARHAQFEQVDGVFMLENLSQANGTFLRIRERVLEEGDVLRIGAQIIRVEYE